MDKRNYQHVIQEMCAHTGVENWQEIAELQHVVVDNITVGLMYRDDDSTSATMFLYFDFGPIEIPDLYQKLLEINGDRQTEEEGSFGCHLQEPAIVYRVQIQLLSENRGAELADKIQYFLNLGHHRLKSALSTMLLNAPRLAMAGYPVRYYGDHSR